MTENAPPGWYQAETDPPGTERYWDGTTWSEETRMAIGPPPQVPSEAPGAGRITPHGREVASAWARIGARLIDVIIVAILSAFLVDVQIEDGQLAYVEALDAVLAVVIAAAYEVLFTALRSATPGKMVLGLEIVRKQDGGSPIGFGPALMRWAPNLVSAISSNLGLLVFLASLVLLFADRYRRTVFDFVGQTYVVRKQRA